jgi:hypothetical protein
MSNIVEAVQASARGVQLERKRVEGKCSVQVGNGNLPPRILRDDSRG